MSTEAKKIVTANEFQLVDAEGRVRGIFSAGESGVEFSMMDKNNKTNLKMMIDNEGLSFLKMFDAESETEKIDISVDSKGTHLFLAGEGKQQSYLFLKKDGASGVVLVDKAGSRKAQVLLSPEGVPNIATF